MIKVTIYNEFLHEQSDEAIKALYPDGIHGQLKKVLECDEVSVRTVTLDTIDTLTKELLDDTDVLLWWGHMGHGRVPDETAALVRDAVIGGMGVIFLHSAHESKPFKLLMGTPGALGWRESGDLARVWNVMPSHPIAQGIGRYFEEEQEETYCEPFEIPKPDELIFVTWYSGGEIMRTGCTWTRGRGKIFYFQPGHETYPVYYNESVIRVIQNAVRWAKPTQRVDVGCAWVAPANGEK